MPMQILNQIFECKEFKRFEQSMQNNHLSHAYFVVGDNAESCHQFCIAMALKLVCETNKPCLQCPSCKKILAGFHPDVFIYPKNKKFVVDDSAEILQNAHIKPLESKTKIFVINDAHTATVQAQNKLLKTVEEAPSHVVFLFNSTAQQKVLPTILSRTQKIVAPNFCQIALADLPDFDMLLDMLKNMQSSKQTLPYAIKFAEKTGFVQRLETLALLFEALMQEKLGAQNKLFADIKNLYQLGAIAEIIDLLGFAKRQFEANVAPNIITDNLLLKILEVRYKWNK